MTPKTSSQPDNTEIMEAIHVFAESVDRRFTAVHSDIKDIRATMVTRDYLDKRLANFVTKDYLDDKLSDLRGDLVVLTRKEDTKLHTLVDILHDKRVIDDGDVRRVERLEPFAR
jgi:patatin-like phospholipase/acyl hydrolase